jgi:hypothetical protein
LQQSLSCVSDAVFVSSHGHKEPGAVRSIKVPRDAGFIPLPGPKRLHLSAGLEYELVETDDPDRGRWKVSTRKYMYHVVTDDHTEVILFHWHPDTSSRTYPHIHLGSSQLLPTAVVGHGDHIPTGRLSFELVLTYLISEQGVVPRRGDWEKVLAENNAAFTQWQTWH